MVIATCHPAITFTAGIGQTKDTLTAKIDYGLPGQGPRTLDGANVEDIEVSCVQLSGEIFTNGIELEPAKSAFEALR